MKPKVHVAAIHKRESREKQLSHMDSQPIPCTKWHYELCSHFVQEVLAENSEGKSQFLKVIYCNKYKRGFVFKESFFWTTMKTSNS